MRSETDPRPLGDFANWIFDLDGTMAESLLVWQGIDERFLGRRGIPCTEDYLHTIKNLRFLEAARYTIARYGLPESPEEVMAEWRAMALGEYKTRIPLRPGALEFVEGLRAAGRRLAVCTSSERAMAEALLRRYGLLEAFSVMTFAVEHVQGKEQPEIWRHCAEALGAAAEDCVVLEDSLSALLGAKAAGCACVAMEIDYHPPEELDRLRGAADYAFTDFSALQAATFA